MYVGFFFFFFSSRRRHTRFDCDWSSDVCSSDLRSVSRWRKRFTLRSPFNTTEVAMACSQVESFASPRNAPNRDRKSTRLNSSHSQISYAVFCLKKKKNQEPHTILCTRADTPTID